MSVLHTRALSGRTVPVCFLHTHKRVLSSQNDLCSFPTPSCPLQIGLIFPTSLLVLLGGPVARSCMATLVRATVPGYALAVRASLCKTEAGRLRFEIITLLESLGFSASYGTVLSC